MKRFGYLILGALLLIPAMVSDALGISLDTFKNEIYRPENLPGGRVGDVAPETKIVEIIDFAVNLILYASGGVAVFMLVIGGIGIITSFGNTDRMTKAKGIVKFAVIGLAAVILAYAAVTNVINLIYSATT